MLGHSPTGSFDGIDCIKVKQQSRENLFQIENLQSLLKDYDPKLQCQTYHVSLSLNNPLRFLKDKQQDLGTNHSFLGFQILLDSQNSFTLEIQIAHSSRGKRKLIFSTNINKIETSRLWTKFPLKIVKRGCWLNLFFDIQSYVEEDPNNISYILESFSLSGTFRLKAVFFTDHLDIGPTQDYKMIFPENEKQRLFFGTGIEYFNQTISKRDKKGNHEDYKDDLKIKGFNKVLQTSASTSVLSIKSNFQNNKKETTLNSPTKRKSLDRSNEEESEKKRINYRNMTTESTLSCSTTKSDLLSTGTSSKNSLLSPNVAHRMKSKLFLPLKETINEINPNLLKGESKSRSVIHPPKKTKPMIESQKKPVKAQNLSIGAEERCNSFLTSATKNLTKPETKSQENGKLKSKGNLFHQRKLSKLKIDPYSFFENNAKLKSPTSKLITPQSTKNSFNPWRPLGMVSPSHSNILSNLSMHFETQKNFPKFGKTLLTPIKSFGCHKKLDLRDLKTEFSENNENILKKFTCETERFSSQTFALNENNWDNYKETNFDVESVEEFLEYENSSPRKSLQTEQKIGSEIEINQANESPVDLYKLFIKDNNNKNHTSEDYNEKYYSNNKLETIQKGVNLDQGRTKKTIKQIEEKVRSIVNSRPFSPPFSSYCKKN